MTFLAENGDALNLDAILDDASGMAAHRRWGAFDAGPSSNTTVPADDCVKDTGVMLDLGFLQNDGLLDTDTGADDGFGSNGHIRAELSGRVDCSGRVDEDWWNDIGRWFGDLLGLRLEGLLQVQGVSWDGRAGGLDLAPEILSFVDVEAVTIRKIRQDILFEAQDLFLFSIFLRVCHEGGFEVLRGRIRNHSWSLGLALDGALDRREDAFSGKEVDTAVDQVGDVALGLLDVVKNSLGVCVGDDATEVSGRLVADSGAQNDRISVLFFEESEHGLEWEGAADVRVEDEEAVRLALENGISKVIETASRAEGLVLSQILDLDLREFSRGVFDKVTEYTLVVVANQDYLFDVGNFGHGFEAMPDDWMASDIEERLEVVS